MRKLVIALTLLAFVFPLAAKAQGNTVKVYSIEGNFSDIRVDLKNAILNRGLYIDYTGYVGDMLKRTAEDVGAKKEIYKDAEFFQFCSATLSRNAMEVDPNAIAFCPYTVFIYELAKEPGKIYVGYRSMPAANDKDPLAAINAKLDEIAKEATTE